MATPRIAIATPSRNAWSETFITAHLERLKAVVLILSGGSLPTMGNDVALISSAGVAARLRNHYELKVLGKSIPAMLRERVTQALRRQRVAVVLAEYGPTGAAMLPICQAAGIPLVVHFHGYDAHKQETLGQQNGYRELLAGAAAVVVVSRAMEEQLIRLGAARERLHFICYGIDTAQFSPNDPAGMPPHFAAVGRFTGKKAPMLTLLAFHRAWLQHPQARLTMAGQGELWEGVWQLRRSLGLEEVVELPGVQTPEQVAGLLRRSRAFVQHSVTPSTGDMEGTPLAILEAMASGLPVISTRHAGINDVVQHERTGVLADEYDVATMADHIARLAAHPALAAQMGAAGRDYVLAHHRVEEQIAKLQTLLEQVVR